jgi:hypothetical protein
VTTSLIPAAWCSSIPSPTLTTSNLTLDRTGECSLLQ